MSKMSMEKGEISLDGFGDRKGFYNKCGVRICGDVRILRSYSTTYAAEFGGVIVALSAQWSMTSGRHIKAFAAFCGVSWNGKKSWNKAPYLGENYTYRMTDAEIAEAVRARVNRIKAAAA